jgi:methionyl-tRNA formyltransferase
MLQDHAQATKFSARKPADGRIDWTRPAQEILNLVRAVAAPYPGAFTDLPEGRLYVWKAEALPECTDDSLPGAVLNVDAGDGFVVRCGSGTLRVLSWTAVPAGAVAPTVGRRLTTTHDDGEKAR